MSIASIVPPSILTFVSSAEPVISVATSFVNVPNPADVWPILVASIVPPSISTELKTASPLVILTFESLAFDPVNSANDPVSIW